MGEIKIALKKEMKTEGEHLVLEILQCRNITYKFKTPDHLPGIVIIMVIVIIIVILINNGGIIEQMLLQHFMYTAIMSREIYFWFCNLKTYL